MILYSRSIAEKVIKPNGDNVYVLAVHPGAVNTKMQEVSLMLLRVCNGWHRELMRHFTNLIAMARLLPRVDGQEYRVCDRVLRKVSRTGSSIGLVSFSLIPPFFSPLIRELNRFGISLRLRSLGGAAPPPRSSRTTTRPLTSRTSRRSAGRPSKVSRPAALRFPSLARSFR